jgi:hypothetical protein
MSEIFTQQVTSTVTGSTQHESPLEKSTTLQAANQGAKRWRRESNGGRNPTYEMSQRNISCASAAASHPFFSVCSCHQAWRKRSNSHIEALGEATRGRCGGATVLAYPVTLGLSHIASRVVHALSVDYDPSALHFHISLHYVHRVSPGFLMVAGGRCHGSRWRWLRVSRTWLGVGHVFEATANTTTTAAGAMVMHCHCAER